MIKHKMVTDWKTFLKYTWVGWNITFINWINNTMLHSGNISHHKDCVSIIKGIIEWHNPKCEFPIEYKKSPN